MHAKPYRLDRRQFIKASFIAGAGLFVGYNLPTSTVSEAAAEDLHIGGEGVLNLDAWIRIHPDDSVTVMIKHSEMGQGITTALCMIVAEEMEADWSKIKAKIAPAAPAYKNPAFGVQATGGSTSVKTSWDILRKMGAATRELILTAAAKTWNVPPSECKANKSTIVHTGSQRSLRYGQLLETAAKQPLPEDPQLKSTREFKIIGKRIQRLDSGPKARGKALFGMDVQMSGLLHATVVHPPSLGDSLKALNSQSAKSMPGVRQIQELESGVAVVAGSFWQAQNAAEALKIDWLPGRQADLSSDRLMANWAEKINEEGDRVRDDGDVESAMAQAAQKLKAVYILPYQAHACPEPINCTAHVHHDGCDVWVATQAQSVVQQVAARVANLELSKVRVHTTYLGGGFGRRSIQDSVAEAVALSKEIDAPVKVIWTREEDLRNDHFRPAFYNSIEAGLDETGLPIAWYHRAVGPSTFDPIVDAFATSFMPQWFPNGIKETAADIAGGFVKWAQRAEYAMRGSATMAYSIDNIRVEYIRDEPGVPIGPWRSVAHSRNAFVVESFIDEIAAASAKDPFDLRYHLLKDDAKKRGVLKLAATKAGWGQPLPDGIHQGIAVHAFDGTPAAMVVEISVADDGNVKVHRVVCAIDCGTVINPKIVEAQMIGGIVFGLTATLKSSVTIKDGRVEQSNFDSFPILRMDEMPEVEVHIVKSTAPPTGVGEVPVPPIAPAVTNAVFAATNKRIRKIPIDPDELRAA